jgi:hypothetical protein
MTTESSCYVYVTYVIYWIWKTLREANVMRIAGKQVAPEAPAGRCELCTRRVHGPA